MRRSAKRRWNTEASGSARQRCVGKPRGTRTDGRGPCRAFGFWTLDHIGKARPPGAVDRLITGLMTAGMVEWDAHDATGRALGDEPDRKALARRTKLRDDRPPRQEVPGDPSSATRTSPRQVLALTSPTCLPYRLRLRIRPAIWRHSCRRVRLPMNNDRCPHRATAVRIRRAGVPTSRPTARI